MKEGKNVKKRIKEKSPETEMKEGKKCETKEEKAVNSGGKSS